MAVLQWLKFLFHKKYQLFLVLQLSMAMLFMLDLKMSGLGVQISEPPSTLFKDHCAAD